jgi:hypothetical protein
VKFKRYKSQKAIDDLLDRTRKQILYASGKVPLSPKIKEMLKSLSPGWTLDKKVSLKPKPTAQIKLDQEDFREDALLKYVDRFNQIMEEVKKRVDSENIGETLQILRQCYSTLKDKRPLNNQVWDDFAPRALGIMISVLLPSLPMLTGKTEDIPLKIRDDLKTRLRKLSKQKDWESLNEETQCGIPKIELVKAQKPSDSQLVDQVIMELLHKDIFKDRIDKIIAQSYGMSDQEIADRIFKATGKSVTKQAVRKRRIHHVEPILKKPYGLLEIRKAMVIDQEEFGVERLELENQNGRGACTLREIFVCRQCKRKFLTYFIPKKCCHHEGIESID